jgi:hypothetical protein
VRSARETTDCRPHRRPVPSEDAMVRQPWPARGPTSTARAVNPGLPSGHGFAPDGRLLATSWVGDDGQRLRSPQGLAVDAWGRLHVSGRDLPGLRLRR